MHKLLLSAVLTLASFAPASAQQTATGESNRIVAPDPSMNCDGPYIGNWKHGYPADDNSC